MANAAVARWKVLLRRLPVPGQFMAAGAGVILATGIGFALHVNLTSISFIYLLLIFGVAMLWGFWQASFASILAAACLDYFFTDPIFHFAISDPQNWVALGMFECAAIFISRLSGKELRSAREAAFHRAGMEQLYELSRSSLLLDLRQAPGSQLVVLIQRIFATEAVALLDLNLGRQDRAGEWGEEEANIAKECYLHEAVMDDPPTTTWRRILMGGNGPVGSLVVRGGLSPLIVDALASLAAIAIDRHQSFEKEERAENASKGEQLRAAVMDALAHEFKTPLTAVQTASSGLLELGELTEAQRDLVGLIDGEATRMNKLCTRLLLTAKLEAGKVGLKRAEVNVQDLIGEVLGSHQDPATRDRVVVSIEDPNLSVSVDRALLAMILQQYLDNALKYSTPHTAIDIEAHRSRTEVLISVHNFGSTIRIEDRERVFERFYRTSEARDAVPGTGIGLSVVRKAAEAHHGHVWVISDERDGTTFVLSLPTGARREL